MEDISHTKNYLDAAKTQFKEGKGRATTGKATLEEASEHFNTMQNARADAVIMALGIVQRLADIQEDLKGLTEVTDKGRGAAKAMHSAAKDAEDDFLRLSENAMEGGLSINQAMGQLPAWGEYPPANDAVEKGKVAEDLARYVKLEASTTDMALTRFTDETAESLQAALKSITTTLNQFVSGPNGLSGIRQSFPIRIAPEENRNPEFIAGVADEVAAAFDRGITDIDQRLEEV